MVQWENSAFPMQEAWIPSLVKKLRIHLSSGVAKKNKKKVYKTHKIPMQEVWVPSPVKKLRIHMSSGVAKRKKYIKYVAIYTHDV